MVRDCKMQVSQNSAAPGTARRPQPALGTCSNRSRLARVCVADCARHRKRDRSGVVASSRDVGWRGQDPKKLPSVRLDMIYRESLVDYSIENVKERTDTANKASGIDAHQFVEALTRIAVWKYVLFCDQYTVARTARCPDGVWAATNRWAWC